LYHTLLLCIYGEIVQARGCYLSKSIRCFMA
jgi:hypothetical protein